HHDAVGVSLVERLLGIGSGERPRAGEGGLEANPFLIAEGDDFDCVIEALAACGKLLDDRERRQRAKVSVVATGVAHRVDVRAGHESERARKLAFVASDDIARRVDPRLEPRLATPADEGARRLGMRVREKEARQAPRLVGEGGEGCEPRHQPASGLEIGFRHGSARQFRAVSSLSQRPSVLRSSSVIWLKLLGGIAWVRTANSRIAGAKRAMCSGVSRRIPFGASPISSIGWAAWHIMQRNWMMSTTSCGALGSSASAAAAGKSARPINVRM